MNGDDTIIAGSNIATLNATPLPWCVSPDTSHGVTVIESMTVRNANGRLKRLGACLSPDDAQHIVNSVNIIGAINEAMSDFSLDDGQVLQFISQALVTAGFQS